MRVFSFSPVKGRRITAFGSKGATITAISRGPRSNQIAALHLEPGGILGAHQAISDQLLIVARGTTTVETQTGQSTHAVTLNAGDAILWRPGEVHETRAGDDGLLAIIVEGDAVARYVAMPSRRI